MIHIPSVTALAGTILDEAAHLFWWGFDAACRPIDEAMWHDVDEDEAA